MAKFGYMLDANIVEVGSGAGLTADGGQGSDSEFARIAVLQFLDPTGNPDDSYMLDGLTRDLTALLARVPGFLVTPYSSAVRIDPESTPGEAMADLLGARYIVSGSLHRRDGNLRIRIALTDAPSQQLIWAERYDATLDRFFEIQDKSVVTISSTIAAGLKWSAPTFQLSERRYSDPVYRRLQRAEQLRVDYSHAAAREIEALLREARGLAPDDAAVLANLAVQLSQSMVSGWSEHYEDDKREALALIDRALSLDPENPDILSAAGVVATMLHRPDDAIRHLAQAHRANPSDAHAMAVLGWQQCLRHDDPGGIALLETAERRAPYHPRFGLWATYRGTAYLFMLDYASAQTVCEAAIYRTPKYYQPLLTTAWALVGLGRTDEASALVNKAMQMEGPDILTRFVDEMERWSANSPNREQCLEVLGRLRALG